MKKHLLNAIFSIVVVIRNDLAYGADVEHKISETDSQCHELLINKPLDYFKKIDGWNGSKKIFGDIDENSVCLRIMNQIEKIEKQDGSSCRFPLQAYLFKKLNISISPVCTKNALPFVYFSFERGGEIKNININNIKNFYVAHVSAGPGVSFFGHILIIGDLCDSPVCKSQIDKKIAFSFLGHIPDVKMSLYSGLLGEYKLALSTSPFYSEIENYTLNEDRKITLYKLKMTPEEVSFLGKALAEWQWRDMGNYSYTSKNCTTASRDLLATAGFIDHRYDGLTGITPSGFVTSLNDAGLIDKVSSENQFFQSFSVAMENRYRSSKTIQNDISVVFLGNYLKSNAVKRNLLLKSLDKKPSKETIEFLLDIEDQRLRSSVRTSSAFLAELLIKGKRLLPSEVQKTIDIWLKGNYYELVDRNNLLNINSNVALSAFKKYYSKISENFPELASEIRGSNDETIDVVYNIKYIRNIL